MGTHTDELKAEIAKLDMGIAFAKEREKVHSEKAEIWRADRTQLEKRRAQAQGQLEREEAPLAKRQPVGVKLDGIDV